MMEALRLHNDTLRKAKWDNCGSTVEQEGDSFSIVFHDAMDAVAFCLQVGGCLACHAASCGVVCIWNVAAFAAVGIMKSDVCLLLPGYMHCSSCMISCRIITTTC